MNQKKLIHIAKTMREKSYAPFSKYTVGTAVETSNGTVIGGCNVESASYGLTCCAERVALYNAISKGFSKFKSMAIASENGGFPCGACRQIIWELCGDISILIIDNENKIRETSSQTLLPDAFDKNNLL